MSEPNRRLTKMPWRIAIGAAILSGLAFGFAQPGWGCGLLGFIFLSPLLGAFRARSWAERAVLGGLAGTVGTAVSVGDVGAEALTAYFGLTGASLTFAWLAALQILGALPFAVFGALAIDPGELRASTSFVWIGSAWILGETLRNLIFPGAWLSLANCLTSTPELLQSASAIGHLGVSFWIAGAGALGYRAWTGPDRRRCSLGLVLLTVMLSGQAIWSRQGGPASGSVSAVDSPQPGLRAIRVVLVQSGLDSRQPTKNRSDRESLEILLKATAAAGTADLVIWPESSFGSVWPFNQALLADAIVSPSFESLLFGAPWVESPSSETELGVAAILVDPNSRIRDRHRKTRLLPLAEDRAFRSFFALGSAGSGYAAAISAEPLDIGSAQLGVSLCYEVLFADLARELVSSGADVLVNLSNESWLGPDTRGPDQMLAAAILRAIEVRRPVVRSTTTGITAAIDSSGRVIASLPVKEEGFLVVDVVPGSENSGFIRFGHLPLTLVVVGWASVLAARYAVQRYTSRTS
jgi:apolipoprotein N-acyltransferase